MTAMKRNYPMRAVVPAVVPALILAVAGCGQKTSFTAAELHRAYTADPAGFAKKYNGKTVTVSGVLAVPPNETMRDDKHFVGCSLDASDGTHGRDTVLVIFEAGPGQPFSTTFASWVRLAGVGTPLSVTGRFSPPSGDGGPVIRDATMN
jgi:hypothetical protein